MVPKSKLKSHSRWAVGDKFRIDHPHGSTGEITYIRTDGSFVNDPHIYVKYYYGVNIPGNFITEVGTVRYFEIVQITDLEFEIVKYSKFLI